MICQCHIDIFIDDCVQNKSSNFLVTNDEVLLTRHTEIIILSRQS